MKHAWRHSRGVALSAQMVDEVDKYFRSVIGLKDETVTAMSLCFAWRLYNERGELVVLTEELLKALQKPGKGVDHACFVLESGNEGANNASCSSCALPPFLTRRCHVNC